MEINVNGEMQRLTKENITIEELLKLNNVESPDTVSVQLNGKFVSRADYSTTGVTDKDQVDFLFFLGGGSFPVRDKHPHGGALISTPTTTQLNMFIFRPQCGIIEKQTRPNAKTRTANRSLL